jgi:hypothetical protein
MFKNTYKLLLLFFLVGCSPEPKETVEVPVLSPARVAMTEEGKPQIVTRDDVAETIWELSQQYEIKFSYRFLSQDSKYVVVDHDWMLEFVDWWNRVKFLFGIKYVAEGFDCDNFSDFVSIAADFSNRDIQAELLIGSIQVQQKYAFGGVPSGGNHALNFFVSNKGIFVLEPQGGSSVIIELDKYPNKTTIYQIDL